MKENVEIRNGGDQTITATLQVEPTDCNPCIIAVSHPDLPLESQEPIFLPLELFSNLAPLPSYNPKKHG
jgi:hypothetical protein